MRESIRLARAGVWKTSWHGAALYIEAPPILWGSTLGEMSLLGRSCVNPSPWPCAKHSPSGGAVFARQPCRHVQRLLGVGQWLCAPPFRVVCPCQASNDPFFELP